jgi:hypothetical protein
LEPFTALRHRREIDEPFTSAIAAVAVSFAVVSTAAAQAPPVAKALKFVHRGSHDDMDSTFELITNYLDEKQFEPKDVFVEQFMKDPVTTPQDDFVIEVYVPLK